MAGVAQYLQEFEDPKDTPAPTFGEKKEVRRARKVFFPLSAGRDCLGLMYVLLAGQGEGTTREIRLGREKGRVGSKYRPKC